MKILSLPKKTYRVNFHFDLRIKINIDIFISYFFHQIFILRKMTTNLENTFVRDPSPNNYSDDGNSESGKTTIPIIEKTITAPPQANKRPTSIGPSCGVPLKSGGHESFNNHTSPIFSHGKNAFAFWTIVTLLFVLTIGNLILTLTIIGVLRLGKGMQNLELVPEAETVKFYGETDLDRVYKRDGMLEGFQDEPVSITG